MNSKNTSSVALILAAAFLSFGCTPKTKTQTVTVAVPGPQTNTTILLERSTNDTSVVFNDLREDASAIQSGPYFFDLDVNYSTSTSLVEQPYDDGFSYAVISYQLVAQSFTATETGKLTSVEVALDASTAQNMTLYVYQNLPSGGALGSPLAAESFTAPAGSFWVTVNLTSPVNVNINTPYYIVLKNTSGNMVGWVNGATDSYAGGNVWVANSGSGYNYGSIPSKDMAFALTIDYKHSPTYQYFYNGVGGALYGSYPAGQMIEIDGGAAGILRFTPFGPAPTGDASDAVSVLVQ